MVIALLQKKLPSDGIRSCGSSAAELGCRGQGWGLGGFPVASSLPKGGFGSSLWGGWHRHEGTRAAAALALPHLQTSRLQLSFQLLMRRFKSGEPCLGARHLELKVIKGEIFSCNRKYWACGDSIIISVSAVRKPAKQIGFWMKHMERWPMYKTYLDLKK